MHLFTASPPHRLTASPPHHLTTLPPHHLTTSPPHHPITSLHLQHLRQSRGSELRPRDVLAGVGPGADLFFRFAEEPGLQRVDVFFHCLVVLGPEKCFAGANALFALPAHAVEEKCAVWRDDALVAGGEE